LNTKKEQQNTGRRSKKGACVPSRHFTARNHSRRRIQRESIKKGALDAIPLTPF
jgi:hypothetical protein